ncbi:hypothetical protein IPA_06090 [Ignicoccus pacificus DSM 13166]|uniref:Uncharacterized protein n=1 Tax=Ignicoccus pacificus DSM 13166 TaxID=940294 RepID=A0A977KCD2_9CREN|nr:hypothetical protein IPA_06090 [Ignicoccus pacificus DSM 13166]
MRLGEISSIPYSVFSPSPPSEVPSELALFHGCGNAGVTLSLLNEYLMEYHRYWFDALVQDAREIIDDVPLSGKAHEIFLESIENALMNAKASLEGAMEVLALTSTALYPQKVNDNEKDLTMISYDIHIRRKYKKVIKNKVLPCLRVATI